MQLERRGGLRAVGPRVGLCKLGKNSPPGPIKPQKAQSVTN